MATEVEIIGKLGKLLSTHATVQIAIRDVVEDQRKSQKDTTPTPAEQPVPDNMAEQPVPDNMDEAYPVIPESVVLGVNSLFERPAREDSSIGWLSRADLAPSMWADVHRIARNAGKKLLDPVVEAARRDPENIELAAIATIASDMYSAFKEQYDAGQAVEAGFKKNFRQTYAGEESANKAAGVSWVSEVAGRLQDNEAVRQARQNTKDALMASPITNYDTPEEYDQKKEAMLIDKYSTLIADYQEQFPSLEEDKLIDAIRIGEKVASYTFIAKHGLLELNDRELEYSLEASAKMATPGAVEIAEITDKLNAEPYNASIPGLNQQLDRNLAGHSRQMQVYAMVEKLCLGTESLQNALPVLEEFGINETAEIRTGREMGAVMGAVGCVAEDDKLVELSTKFSSAKSKDELDAILQSPEFAESVERMHNIDPCKIPEAKRETVQEAISMIGDAPELDCRAKSAKRHAAPRAESSIER